MRGLVGMATVMTVMAWFVARTGELVDDMQTRVATLESAAAFREQALGLDEEPLVATGTTRRDWKALLGTDETLPTGIKQREVWKDNTAKLLAGRPITREELRARGPDADTLHAAAERRRAELVAQR